MKAERRERPNVRHERLDAPGDLEEATSPATPAPTPPLVQDAEDLAEGARRGRDWLTKLRLPFGLFRVSVRVRARAEIPRDAVIGCARSGDPRSRIAAPRCRLRGRQRVRGLAPGHGL